MFRFFRKYHYVPPCPRCGSLKTGRFYYVTNTAFGVEKVIAENLKYGELVRVVTGFGDELEYNAYCEDCDIKWMAKIEEYKLTDERITQECKDRGISKETINNMVNIKKISKAKKKEEKKAEKRNKKEFKNKQKAKNVKKNKNTPQKNTGKKMPTIRLNDKKDLENND